jgi:Zn-dependent protease with chaperone function
MMLLIARSGIGLSLLFFALSAHSASANLDKDEAGLWMVMDKQEQLLRTSNRHIDNNQLNHYLQDMACGLAGPSCEDLRVYVVRAPGFNAFMMPNGAMGIFSGLLIRVHDESELATVIGHEIAHYEREHSINNYRAWRRTSSAYTFASALITAGSAVAISSAGTYEGQVRAANISNTAALMLQTAGVFAQFQLIAYGRGQEAEADRDGFRYLSEAGYDPRGAPRIWERLIAEQSAGGKESGFSMLATHPPSESRREKLAKLADSIEGDPVSTKDGVRLRALLEPYREDWLNDELHAQHPDQFTHVVLDQLELGVTPGFGHYLIGNAWLRFAKRQDGKEAQMALRKASEAFADGAESESGLPTDGYRDWARTCEKLGQPDRAREHYAKYLELDPDAWDAKYIRRELGLL